MEEENNNGSIDIKEATKKAKDTVDKAKKTAGTIKKIIKVFIKHPWLIWVVVGAIALIILLASFAWLLNLLDNRNSNDAIAAATGSITYSSSEEENQDDEIIPCIQTVIKQIDGEYRYAFIFDITDEEREVVNNILNQNSIELTEENLNFVTALVRSGYKIEDNLNKDTLESLLLFYKAQVASESLDLRSSEEILVDGEYTACSISLEEEGVQGTVRLERINIDGNSKTQRSLMSYIPLENFEQLLQENSQDAKKYFTVNSAQNCLISGWRQTKVTYEYPEDYPLEKEQNIDTTTVSCLNGDGGIPYKNYISNYTMPWELLTSLRIYLDDMEFCRNLVKCVENSNIVISLHETSVIQTSEYTEEHKIRDVKYYDYFYSKEGTANKQQFIKKFSSLEKIKEYMKNGEYGFPDNMNITLGSNEWIYNDDKYTLNVRMIIDKVYVATLWKTEKTSEQGSATPIILQNDKTYTALEQTGTYSVKTTRVNINNTNKLDITKISVWYLEYLKVIDTAGDRTTDDTGTQNSGGTTETEIDPKAVYTEYPKTELNQDQINNDTYIKQYKSKIGNAETVWNNEKCNAYINRIVDKIPKTYRNITEKREERAPRISKSSKVTEEENGFLYYYNQSETAKSNMNSISQWLFSAMLEYEKTEPLIDVIKYLLYIYDGTDYGVTELNIDVQDIGEFNLNEYSNVSLEKYLRQFSHGTTESNAPKSDDGKYYLMYGDLKNSAGWPTIGDSDIQWASHYQKFNVSGLVLENNVEKEVSNVAEYVRQKLGGDNKYQGTDAEIRAKQIYINVELVNSVGEEIRNIIVGLVESEIGDINLSKQQKYALIEIGYARGHKYLEGFRETYNKAAGSYEIDSPEFNMYIWDNWWYNNGVASNLGKIKGQDAAFETYLKGTFDFSKPYEPSWMGVQGTNVFDRKYMLFYTKAQLAELKNPSVKTARESGDTTEIFTYVEGASGFLEVAEEIWQIIYTSFGKYGSLNTIPPRISANIYENQVDCSGYVSWVLYEYGYTDITSQISSEGFYNTNWTERYGWEEIPFSQGADITDLIQPGDIVVRRANSVGHVAIVVEPLIDGAESYDCGAAENWMDSGGYSVEKSYFYTGENLPGSPQLSAPGKIIRVTAP